MEDERMSISVTLHFCNDAAPCQTVPDAGSRTLPARAAGTKRSLDGDRFMKTAGRHTRTTWVR